VDLPALGRDRRNPPDTTGTVAGAEGFLAACLQGRALGFDGKTLFHPKAIAAANSVFAPSSEELAWSRQIIAAHAKAVAAGKGIVLAGGRLVENLYVQSAHQTVARTEAIASLDHGSTYDMCPGNHNARGAGLAVLWDIGIFSLVADTTG
jgi:hypothetical protein